MPTNRFPHLLLFALPLLAFVTYVMTLAPTFTDKHWGIDTAELALAAHRLTVPHPSGYPVYLLYGKLATFLPWGDVAYRLNLMSAFFAALTVGLMTWTLQIALKKAGVGPRAAAFGSTVGSAMLAFSSTFWSQALIAEVYTLQTFFLVLVLLLLILWRENLGTEHARRLLVLTALTFGLGLGNHLMLVLAAPAMVLFILLTGATGAGPEATAGTPAHAGVRIVQQATRGAGLTAKDGLGAGLACSLGLTPYLLLLLRAQQGAWPSLWDPSTPLYLWDHITGGPFQALLFHFPLPVILSRLAAAATFTLSEYGILGFALAMAGTWFMAHQDRPFLAFCLLTGGTTLLFALNYPVFDSQVYLIPFYLILAVCLGWGVAQITELLGRLSLPGTGTTPGSSTRLPVTLWLISLLFLALPALSFVTTYPRVDVSGDLAAYSRARYTLETLPKEALLLSWGGPETFGLWYLQYAEGFRQDVLVVDGALWGWVSYQRNLERHYPGLAPPIGTPHYLEMLIQNTKGKRPIYATPATATARPDLNFPGEGALFRPGS